MIKRKKKRKEKVDFTKIVKTGGFFCNAAILGDNTDFY